MSSKLRAELFAHACGAPEAAVDADAPKLQSPDNADDLDAPIWGAPAISAEIRKGLQATYHLIKTGSIPATKLGGQWVTTRRRLRAAFNGSVSTAQVGV
jgi:hypothetical protein